MLAMGITACIYLGYGKQNGMKELNKNETVTSPTLSNNSEKNLTEAELQVSFSN